MIGQASNAQNVFTDINGLQNISKLGKADKSAALKEVAKQFESMFVGMMMSSMRKANAAFSEDSLFNSSDQDFYRGMYDDQMALSLTNGRGTGLAEVIHRQLMTDYGTNTAAKELDQSKLYNRRVSTSLYSTPKKERPKKLDLYGLENSKPEKLKKGQHFSSPLDFIQKVYPAAEKVGKKMGVNPKLIVSQAALETGWGKYMIEDANGNNSHNLFGIKADSRWKGEKVSVRTHEYIDGVRVNQAADFRSYTSINEAVEDYANFLQGHSRYQKAIRSGQSIDEYGYELQKAGYATDPFYGKKIENIVHSDTMKEALTALELKVRSNDG